MQNKILQIGLALVLANSLQVNAQNAKKDSSLTAFGQSKHEIQRKGLVFGISFGIANSNL